MRLLSLCIPLLALACGEGQPAGSADNGDVERERARASFRRVISDDELRGILDRHGIEVSAVFMSVGGMSGTHRVASPRTPLALMEEAREQTMRALRGSLDNGRLRFERFVSQYTPEDLEGNDILGTHARSMLAIVQQLQSVIASVESNEPLVHSVEILATPSVLTSLEQEPLLTTVRPWVDVLDGQPTRPPPAALSSDDPNIPPEIQNLTPGEVYEAIQVFAASKQKGEQK